MVIRVSFLLTCNTICSCVCVCHGADAVGGIVSFSPLFYILSDVIHTKRNQIKLKYSVVDDCICFRDSENLIVCVNPVFNVDVEINIKCQNLQKYVFVVHSLSSLYVFNGLLLSESMHPGRLETDRSQRCLFHV